MGSDSLYNKFQKYLPFILVIGTLLIGGYLLQRKGIISLPINTKKENIVNLGKGSIVDLLFKGEEFKLSYAGMDPNSLVDIAKFDKTEQWQGSGSVEEDVVLGGTVMAMVDRDRQKSTSTLLKNLNLAGVDNIKFVVNFKNDAEDVETLNLLFGNKDGTSHFRFPITNLKMGMNYFSIPKYRFFLVEESKEIELKKEATAVAEVKTTLGWDKIERVQLELVSRPGSKVSADIGWIRAEKEDIFTPDWKWDGNEHFLNLYHTADGKLALRVIHVGRGLGTLRRIGSVKDFTYSVKITSYKEGFIGLYFRGDFKTGFGYFLAVGGIRTNDWSLSKYYSEDEKVKTDLLLKGQIGNFEFSRDQPFWLKVTAKGTNIATYFSLDGKDYTKLGEVIDKEFSSGGLGIASSGGAGIFDDFYLSLK